MKHQSIMMAVMTAALAMPAWAQQPAAPSGSAETQAKAVRAALVPLILPHAAALSAAGVQKVVARTGKKKRDVQVTTRWGPAYFPWPKGVTPVAFDLYVTAADDFVVSADGYTEANKPRYAAAFDAVLPQAVRSANAVQAQATRPKH